MKKYNRDLGTYGESLAIEHILHKGYEVLDKNYKCTLGEIDIIAKQGEVLAFIEVKSRFNSYFGKPLESVNYIKKNRIINASRLYLQKNKLFNFFIRYDVIEITFLKDIHNYKINLLQDAFRL